jgi:hypothetical protein
VARRSAGSSRRERERRRGQRRFADPDAEPRQQQLVVAACNATQHGHDAPDRDADPDDGAPTSAIRRARDRNAEQCVEQREREAVQHAHLRVTDAKVAPDRADEQPENLSIDEREVFASARTATTYHAYRGAGKSSLTPPRRTGRANPRATREMGMSVSVPNNIIVRRYHHQQDQEQHDRHVRDPDSPGRAVFHATLGVRLVWARRGREHAAVLTLA